MIVSFRSLLFQFYSISFDRICLCSIFQYFIICCYCWSLFVWLLDRELCNEHYKLQCQRLNMVHGAYILPYFFPIPFADDPCTWCSKKIEVISLVAGYRCLFVINSKMLKLKPTTQSNITNDEFIIENVKLSFSCCEGKKIYRRKK